MNQSSSIHGATSVPDNGVGCPWVDAPLRDVVSKTSTLTKSGRRRKRSDGDDVHRKPNNDEEEEKDDGSRRVSLVGTNGTAVKHRGGGGCGGPPPWEDVLRELLARTRSMCAKGHPLLRDGILLPAVSTAEHLVELAGSEEAKRMWSTVPTSLAGIILGGAKDSEQVVLTRLARRYRSFQRPLERYEFVVRMRAHDDALHESLVRSGRLQRRLLLDETNQDVKTTTTTHGKNKGAVVVCANDPWICKEEPGRHRNRRLRFRGWSENDDSSKTSTTTSNVIPFVWFYLPNYNGAPPQGRKDARWKTYRPVDHRALERRYREFKLQSDDSSNRSKDFEGSQKPSHAAPLPPQTLRHYGSSSLSTFGDDAEEKKETDGDVAVHLESLPQATHTDDHDVLIDLLQRPQQNKHNESNSNVTEQQTPTPTQRKGYVTNISNLLWWNRGGNQTRTNERPDAISTAPGRKINDVDNVNVNMDTPTETMTVSTNRDEDEDCDETESVNESENGESDDMDDEQVTPLAKWYEPTSDDVLVDERRYAVTMTISDSNTQNEYRRVVMVQRPTMWRFHGPGDSVRRSAWLLDTSRHGLQPYDDASAELLEEAYDIFTQFCFDTNKDKVKDRDNRSDTVTRLTIPLPAVRMITDDEASPQVVEFVLNSHKHNHKDKAKSKGGLKTTSINDIEILAGGTFSVGTPLPLFLPRRRVYRGLRCCRQHKCSGEDMDNAVPNENNQDIEWKVAAPLDLLRREDESETEAEADYHAVNNDDVYVEPEPPAHLVLVIHGIGEALRTVDLFGIAQLSNLVECCDSLRRNHTFVSEAKNLGAEEENDDSVADNSNDEERQKSARQRRRRPRVEFLPVEWHEAFSMVHTDRKQFFEHISLPTIPHWRAFANDNLLDVLYFMSPGHHDALVETVEDEMNLIVRKFRSLTGFQDRDGGNGQISILAHSLGSLVAWDILSRPTMSTTNCPESSSPLSFRVSHTFLLGSPLAVFLLIRRGCGHSHRDGSRRRRRRGIEAVLSSDHVLPGCPRVYNLFHPYDPAAYRIEPLIDPRNASVEAELVAHWNSECGYRVQYRTRRMWRDLLRSKERALKATMSPFREEDHTDNDNEDEDYVVRCGRLNRGRRIDYVLQEHEIENANEYVFALMAHSAYWDEKDLSLFIARQLLQDCPQQLQEESSSASLPSSVQTM